MEGKRSVFIPSEAIKKDYNGQIRACERCYSLWNDPLSKATKTLQIGSNDDATESPSIANTKATDNNEDIVNTPRAVEKTRSSKVFTLFPSQSGKESTLSDALDESHSSLSGHSIVSVGEGPPPNGESSPSSPTAVGLSSKTSKTGILSNLFSESLRGFQTTESSQSSKSSKPEMLAPKKGFIDEIRKSISVDF